MSPLFVTRSDGGPLRRASQALEQRGSEICASVARAVPFFTRQRVIVSTGSSRSGPLGELLSDDTHPLVLHLATDPGGSRAALALDRAAAAFLLDGVLGGPPGPLLELPGELTGPQRALLGRTLSRIAESISKVFAATSGFSLTRLPPVSGQPHGDAIFVALDLRLGDPTVAATMTLAVAREALLANAGPINSPDRPVDPRVATTLEAVELELVAELGRLKMSFGALCALRVGDILTLDTALSDAVSVRADSENLFEGRPTTSGDRIAICIEGRHSA